MRNQCKDCGGIKICENQQIKSHCKECGDSSICEHHHMQRLWWCEHLRAPAAASTCRDCSGSGLGEYQRVRSTCRDFGSGSICEQQRVRRKCKDCGGGSISEEHLQRLWRWQPLRGTRGRGASSKAAMATARGEEILLPNISTFLAKSKSKSSLVCDLTPLWVGHVCIRG